jgi:uncharacterized protein (DUF885 family)
MKNLTALPAQRACRWLLSLLTAVLVSGCDQGAPEGGEGASAVSGPLAAADSHADHSAALAAFVDDFIAARDGDSRSDLSRAHFASELEQTRADLARLRSIDPAALSFDEGLDWKFAQSILRGREIWQQDVQNWRYDPRVYLRFRELGMTVQGPGQASAKVDELLAILEALPKQFRSGQANLESYIPRFQELSLFMAEGALSIFTDDVTALAAEVPEREEEILAANAAAIAALQGFMSFMETELPDKPAGDWAIGESVYNAFLRDELLLSMDAEELYSFARGEFDKTVREMEELAARIDPSKSWQELAIEIKNDYPEPQRMIEVHQEWVNRSRDHVLANNLVPIPWKERVDVVPRARYLRKYSYYGNFSRARAANEDGVFVAQWMINPFEEQWDEQTKAEYLVEHDYGVIIVTAPHESYAGHHVQGLYQMHNPSALRRENGLSLFSEGWGLYQEQLFRETGFYPDDRIVLRHLQLRLWRNARVVWDVGIHTGRMSYEEAISLLSDDVGFLRWAAQLEVDGSAQRPIYRLGYFLGMSEILAMREEYRARRGEAFTLSEFHERLLKVGNMPTSLMREGLMATLDD